jgi:hypothetical protein
MLRESDPGRHHPGLGLQRGMAEARTKPLTGRRRQPRITDAFGAQDPEPQLDGEADGDREQAS